VNLTDPNPLAGGKGARSGRGATASASDPTAFAAVFCREPLLLKLLLDAFVAMPAVSLAATTYTLPWSAAFNPAAAEAAAAVGLSVQVRPFDSRDWVWQLAGTVPTMSPRSLDLYLSSAHG